MIISLNKDINCELVCRVVKELIQKNVKSKEQANNMALSITIVEIKDAEEDTVPKLEWNNSPLFKRGIEWTKFRRKGRFFLKRQSS